MTVTLTIAGRRHEGWTAATVTRALETIAGQFRITLSERAPGETTPRVIRAGDSCELALEGDRVLKGHVDTARISYDAGSHTIEVSGRDATGDLVDCSASLGPRRAGEDCAEKLPSEWHGETLEAIASALAAPFGIPVRAEADTGRPLRRFRIEEGETAFEAIERACRFRGVLPLSDGNGGLVLGRPSRSRTAVPLERGVNILSASGESSWLDRFSEYTLLGQQPGSDFLTATGAAHVSACARDGGVTRHRPLAIVAEQGLDAAEAQERIDWEASVRAARSRRATITVQGWRETPGGPLWQPGRLVKVKDDWLGLDRDLLVATVQQSLSEAGTVTGMTLMSEQAFAKRIEREASDPTGFWDIPLDAMGQL